MKNLRVFLVLPLVIAWMAISLSAVGAPVPKYSGDMHIQPKVVHQSELNGMVSLLYEEQALKQVGLKADAPIYGKTDFVADDQWSASFDPGAAASQQLVVAFKFQGPPHKWYFVWVGNSVDGGLTYAGKIFKAIATLNEIKVIAKDGFASDPAAWKPIGQAIVKKL